MNRIQPFHQAVENIAFANRKRFHNQQTLLQRCRRYRGKMFVLKELNRSNYVGRPPLRPHKDPPQL